MNYEGLYLIREREFLRFNEDIYKIGKSQHVLSRVKSYPKESMLHLIIFCKKSDDYEKDLIKILTNKFKLASRYGAEYFEGNLNKIILEIETFMKNKQCVVCKVNNTMTHTVNEKFINTKNVIKTIYPIDNEVLDNDSDIESEDEEEKDINILLNNYKGKRILHTCKMCSYSTSKHSNFSKHLETTKHKNNLILSKQVNPNDIINKIDKQNVILHTLLKESNELKIHLAELKNKKNLE
jgi:hypothetical protein